MADQIVPEFTSEPKETPVTTETTLVSTPATPTEPTQPAQSDTKEIQEKLEGTITERVSKTLLEKIGGALGLTKEQKKELPSDPEELAQFVRDNAKQGVQEILSEKEKQEQEAEQEKQTQLQEGATRFQQLWKNQYDQLAESGKVPKITNANDKSDPGNVAKIRILTKLYQIIKENQEKGIDYVPTLKEVYYENPDVVS